MKINFFNYVLQDFMCRLCSFVTINVNEIIDHIMTVHDIVMNKKKKDWLDNYTISELQFVCQIKFLKYNHSCH